MVKTASGTVHGRTIELDGDLGIADGQKVELVVRFVNRDYQPGDGIRRTAGMLANDTEWDRIMEEIQQERKQGRATSSEDE